MCLGVGCQLNLRQEGKADALQISVQGIEATAEKIICQHDLDSTALCLLPDVSEIRSSQLIHGHPPTLPGPFLCLNCLLGCPTYLQDLAKPLILSAKVQMTVSCKGVVDVLIKRLLFSFSR